MSFCEPRAVRRREAPGGTSVWPCLRVATIVAGEISRLASF